MPKKERPEKDDLTTPPISAPVAVIGGGIRVLLRQTLAIIGLLLIILSVPIGFLTPFIPLGLPLGILGVVLLGRNAVWGQRWLNHMLAKRPSLERYAPNWLMKLVFGRDKRPEFSRR